MMRDEGRGGGREKVNSYLWMRENGRRWRILRINCVNWFTSLKYVKGNREGIWLKNRVMRFSRYENVGRTNVKLSGEQLEIVDCFKYFGPFKAAQLAQRGNWYKTSEGKKFRGTLKCLRSDRGSCLSAKKCTI